MKQSYLVIDGIIALSAELSTLEDEKEKLGGEIKDWEIDDAGCVKGIEKRRKVKAIEASQSGYSLCD